MDYRDWVITDLADENAALRERCDQLVDLVADLTREHWRVHRRFVHVLKVADDARVVAQRERDAVLARLESEIAA